MIQFPVGENPHTETVVPKVCLLHQHGLNVCVQGSLGSALDSGKQHPERQRSGTGPLVGTTWATSGLFRH